MDDFDERLNDARLAGFDAGVIIGALDERARIVALIRAGEHVGNDCYGASDDDIRQQWDEEGWGCDCGRLALVDLADALEREGETAS